MLPPYESPLEQAQAEEAIDAVDREIGLWDETTTRRYFLAGGGTESRFREQWTAALAPRRRAAEAVIAGTYSCAGGSLFYLAWGWREGIFAFVGGNLAVLHETRGPRQFGRRRSRSLFAECLNE